MLRHWYLIDGDGRHRIDVSEDSWDFWSGFREGDEDDAPWPAFTQMIVCTELEPAVDALLEAAEHHDYHCRELTDHPEQWDESVCICADRDLTLMGEPSVDFADRLVTPEFAEHIIAHLEVDAAFFGYDPSAGTLTLTVFSQGEPGFSWSDSLEPGPSHAVTFHDDGTATDEDPRRFALERMDQPPTSPFLDRYAFVEHELRKLGIDEVDPDLSEHPIVAVFRLEPNQSQRHG
jgi:hypothetical protein